MQESKSIEVVQIDTMLLVPHERNTEFFDDIEGTKWEDFKASIQMGIKSPLIINQDNVIISGHQRWRAACELGIEMVPVIRYEYPNKDSELLDMIALNVQQRFAGQSNDVKTAKCAKELERLCGKRRGRPSSDEKVSHCDTFSRVGQDGALSQKQIAEMFEVSPTTLRELYALLKLVPELQEAVEEGKITTSVASRLLSKLDVESQTELVEELGPEILGKIPMGELQKVVPQIKSLKEEIDSLKEEVRSNHRAVYSESELDEANRKVEELEQEKRSMYEKYRAATKEHDAEIRDLQQKHKKETARIVELQVHMAELERSKKALRDISKLEEDDLRQLSGQIKEVSDSIERLLEIIGSVA